MVRTSISFVRILQVAAVLLLLTLSARLTTAAPVRQAAPTCQWIRLATGETLSQTTLVPFPGVGVLSFGGLDQRSTSTQSTIKDDVWQLDLTATTMGTWTELNPTGSGPGKRDEHAAVMRTLTGGGAQLITYGGQDSIPAGTLTWQSPLMGGGSSVESRLGEYAPTDVQNGAHALTIQDGKAAWNAISGAQGQARADHSTIWFPDEDALIMFGGRQTEDATSADNTTWKLSLTDPIKWTRIQATGGPTKRFAHSAVYDSTAKRMLIFGGTVDWKSGNNEVWALDLSKGTVDATWQKLTGGFPSPQGRFDLGAVYLPSLNWMVLFGGTANGNNQVADTWALDLSGASPHWMSLSPTGQAPVGVSGLAAAYSPIGDYAVFYGGQTGGRARRDAWALKCDSGAPTPMPTVSSVPPTPPEATAVPTEATPSTVTPTNTAQPAVTPTMCPQPTPELFQVEPVTSPTNLLTQVITVRIGNGEAVTVTTESGVFPVYGSFDAYNNAAKVEVRLNPGVTHTLQVAATVRRISGPGGCPYGGYTLTTSRDKNGKTLVIVQQRGDVSPNIYLPLGLKSHDLRR